MDADAGRERPARRSSGSGAAPPPSPDLSFEYHNRRWQLVPRQLDRPGQKQKEWWWVAVSGDREVPCFPRDPGSEEKPADLVSRVILEMHDRLKEKA